MSGVLRCTGASFTRVAGFEYHRDGGAACDALPACPSG